MTYRVERSLWNGSGSFAILGAAVNPKEEELLHATPEKGGGDQCWMYDQLGQVPLVPLYLG